MIGYRLVAGLGDEVFKQNGPAGERVAAFADAGLDWHRVLSSAWTASLEGGAVVGLAALASRRWPQRQGERLQVQRDDADRFLAVLEQFTTAVL